ELGVAECDEGVARGVALAGQAPQRGLVLVIVEARWPVGLIEIEDGERLWLRRRAMALVTLAAVPRERGVRGAARGLARIDGRDLGRFGCGCRGRRWTRISRLGG